MDLPEVVLAIVVAAMLGWMIGLTMAFHEAMEELRELRKNRAGE